MGFQNKCQSMESKQNELMKQNESMSNQIEIFKKKKVSHETLIIELVNKQSQFVKQIMAKNEQNKLFTDEEMKEIIKDNQSMNEYLIENILYQDKNTATHDD